jgi:hypothetical protein
MKQKNRQYKANTLRAKKIKENKNLNTSKKNENLNDQTTPFKWNKFYTKGLLIFAIIVLVVIFTDVKGYFQADQTNNHVDRKWKSFYQFTKTKNVDILLFGNSHVMTGVDPFVLSVATGTNCFILGTPGASVSDAYFCLVEALSKTKPQLVILETYCINNAEKNDTKIANIQSFEANQNILYKLQMMPEIFNSDDWIKAWSPTIRNHSFLLTNLNQIKFNIKNINKRNVSSNRLDLGRFARFGTGLEDSTLIKYETLGAPNDGAELRISARSKKYLNKFVSLCQSKNIPVLFLTVPVYYKHVANYDILKETLTEEFKKYQSVQWLDLQSPYDSLSYTKDEFENTFEKNQHLTNSGMTITAYKLADFLLSNSSYKLADRSKEPNWIGDFQSQPHFIFNQDLIPNMKNYISIQKNKTIGNLHVKELILRQNDNDFNTLIIKITNNNELPSYITGIFKTQYQNQIISMPIKMDTAKEVMSPKYKVYFINLRKDIKILDIDSIQ